MWVAAAGAYDVDGALWLTADGKYDVNVALWVTAEETVDVWHLALGDMISGRSVSVPLRADVLWPCFSLCVGLCDTVGL